MLARFFSALLFTCSHQHAGHSVGHKVPAAFSPLRQGVGSPVIRLEHAVREGPAQQRGRALQKTHTKAFFVQLAQWQGFRHGENGCRRDRHGCRRRLDRKARAGALPCPQTGARAQETEPRCAREKCANADRQRIPSADWHDHAQSPACMLDPHTRQRARTYSCCSLREFGNKHNIYYITGSGIGK